MHGVTSVRWSLALVCLLCGGLPGPVSLAEVDLQAPAMQKLKAAYEAEKAPLTALRKKKLQAVLDKELTDTKALLAEKKRAGNISGIAAGNTAVALFTACLQELEEKGEFELPETVRRELRGTVKSVGEAKQAIETEFQAACAALDDRYRQQMAQEAAAQGVTDLAPEALGAVLTQLLQTEITPAEKPAEETPAPTATPGEGEPATEIPAAPSTPQVIATSATGTNWVSIGRWYAHVSSIELINVRVVQRDTRDHEERGATSPLGQPYEMIYEPIRVLSSGPGYKFQLKSLPGHEAPSVVEWPDERNNWTLQVRARPGREVPSKHGAEIMVAFPGAEALPLLSERLEAEAADDGTRVNLVIRTLPDGALVYVDGRPFKQGNAFLKTPCSVPVRPGQRNIRLRKFGYNDVVIADMDAVEGATIERRMEKDTRVADQTVEVNGKRWVNSGVTVNSGDKITIEASGTWSCVSDNESVDAAGYPNNQEFYKYYINPQKSPRQLAGQPYGMLIMRIGIKGELQRVGKSLRTTAATRGEVWFDVNEDENARFRRDNSGALSVHIRKVPGDY